MKKTITAPRRTSRKRRGPTPAEEREAQACAPLETLREEQCAMSIGAQIEAAMRAHGIGVTELARRMGRDHGHVSRVVNGRMVPGADWLQDCADVLGCELTVPAPSPTRSVRPSGMR